MRYLFYIIIFLTLALKSNSQIVITGKLINDKSNPLEFVTVVLIKDSTEIASTISDSDGNYKISKLNSGTYLIRFSYINFYKKEIKININRDTTVNVQLTNAFANLKEVVVTSKKRLIERKVDRIIFNVANSPLSLGKSAWDILPLCTGVQTTDKGEIKINGIAGVKVMIDERTLYLKGQLLLDFLNSLNAEDIKSIEIIAYPPANYDAEGAGGIIRIVTKRRHADGIEINLASAYKQGTYPKFTEGLGINFKKNNLIFWGSFNYNNRNGFYKRYDSNTSRINPISIANDRNSLTHYVSNSFIAGVEYNISSRHFIGVQTEGVWSKSDANTSILTNFLTNNKVDTIIRGIYPSNNNNNNQSVSFNYRWKIDTIGTEIKILSDYNIVNSLSGNLYENKYFNHMNVPINNLYRRSKIGDSLKIFTSQYDAVFPFRKNKNTKLETGAKLSSVNTRNANLFDLYNFPSNKWDVDSSQTNHFKYDEKILSGYINFSSCINQFEYMAGLRLENTNAKSISTTSNLIYTTNYLKLFTSMFVKYNFKKAEERYLSFSYSKRITRPVYIILNPFSYLLNEYTIKKGNPLLQPEIMNAFELSFAMNRSFSFVLNYYRATESISDVEYRNGSYTIETFGNVNKSNSIQLGLNYSADITKWWNSYNQINLNYRVFQSVNYKQDYAGFYFYTMNHIRLTGKSSIQFGGNFYLKGVDLYYKDLVNYALFNISFQQQLFNKKLLLSFSLNDIFYRDGYSNTILDYLEQHNTTLARWDTRQYGVGIKYIFRKGKKTEKSDLEKSNLDEMKRVGN